MLKLCRKTFWRIVKHRSTEDFESIPYVCTLLNAYFWIYYGLIKPNSLLVATINCFGIVAETVYLTLFLIFAPPGLRVSSSNLLFKQLLGQYPWFLLPSRQGQRHLWRFWMWGFQLLQSCLLTPCCMDIYGSMLQGSCA